MFFFAFVDKAILAVKGQLLIEQLNNQKSQIRYFKLHEKIALSFPPQIAAFHSTKYVNMSLTKRLKQRKLDVSKAILF